MAVTEIPPTAVGPDARCTEWLEAEICTLAGHIAAATCRFLLLVAEFDRRGGWRTWECLSAAHWLSWKCGISRRTAQDHVRVGRALEELPVMTAAFGTGQLSYSKVRAMTRVATPKSESDLVDVAMHGTAAHVDRIVAGFCTARRNADPDRAHAQHRRRGVWSGTAEDGTVTITVRGASDATATILSRDRRGHCGAPEPRGRARRRRAPLDGSTRSSTWPGRTWSPTCVPHPRRRSSSTPTSRRSRSASPAGRRWRAVRP